MGTPWTLEVDPLALYPYAEDGWAKSSLGDCIAACVFCLICLLFYITLTLIVPPN
jgi:hypothetical protein